MAERLAQARKMAAIGRMAAGIAHNFNNTLYVAIGNLEMAREDLPPESSALANIIEAEKATRRAADMSRLMLTYLGQQRIRTRTMDLSETVKNLLQSLKKELPTGTAVEEELPRPGPVVSADEKGVEQILRALITNAAEALEDDRSGHVTVSVEETASPELGERRRFPADWDGGDPVYACITVADGGKGMDEATIDAAFDPFYTDKFTGRGLGLAAALGIVKAHGGCIAVESAPGQGSVFRVFLPLVSGSANPIDTLKSTHRKRASGEGTILLVDDEEMVRELARTILERLGFDVVSAGDGVDALERFRSDPDRIRLLICDLSLPGMDGWEILAKIRGIRPDIPAILISGYDRSDAMAGSHPEQPQAFLQKPFKKNALKETIEQVLAR
jgi:CheY-like chemotaxis protein